MKRIFSFLFAIIALVGTIGVFTSCQEDAPEINYTINITVNNDFTEVVNAINNGTMKQTEAIAALTAAIEKMNGDQAAKLQAIIEAINTLASTLDAKLAIMEAAMKAQTLALETKLDLLTAAVEAQTLKQEEMAELFATAIDNLSGSIENKLDAIKSIIESTSATLAEKIAAVEAAMKAQTLALENKLALLEAAIKALPDYTDQLKAIEAAIKGMPDYSDKLAAIETAVKNIPDYSEKMDAIEAAIKNAPDYTTALEEIKEAIAASNESFATQIGMLITAIENLPDYGDQLTAIKNAIPSIPDYSDQIIALETALEVIADRLGTDEETIADKLQALSDEIAKITEAVEAGNKSQEDALAEIIALLESGALAGGGSGSGSGGEGTTPSITFTTELLKDINVSVIPCKIKTAEGVSLQNGYPNTSGTMGYTHYGYERTNNDNPIKLTFDGNPTVIDIYGNEIIEIDLSQLTALEEIDLHGNNLTKVDFSHNKNLKEIMLYENQITGENMTALVESLPDRTGKETGKLYLKIADEDDESAILLSDIAIAEGKNWEVLYTTRVKIESGSITYTTSLEVGAETAFTVRPTDEITSIEGATEIKESLSSDGKSKFYTFKLTSQTVKINGVIERFKATFKNITSLDVTNMYSLNTLDCTANEIVTLAIDKEKNRRLKDVWCGQNLIEGDNMTAVVNGLHDRKYYSQGYINLSTAPNKLTDEQKAIAEGKNWDVR